MIQRLASCSLLVISFCCIATQAWCGTGGGCIPAVYLVKEASGTQSLWRFSSDGTLQSASSAQGPLNFGDAYGTWSQAGRRQVKSTFLDFTYDQVPVGSGFPPAGIARVDAVATFSDHCNVIHGSFELRFFDPDTEDPLDPSTDTGTAIRDTFTGRRMSVR